MKNNLLANEYQQLAARTLIDAPLRELTAEETMILWNAMGVAGEAGELVDYIKKGIFHEHGLDNLKLIDEMGDLLWYIAALATKLGLDLERIMVVNIGKLKARYPEGFSAEDSKSRA